MMSRLGGSGGYLGSGAQFARACYAHPVAKLFSLLKSALVSGAVLGLIQPAFAVGVISNDQPVFPNSGQGVYAALLDVGLVHHKPFALEAVALKCRRAYTARTLFRYVRTPSSAAVERYQPVGVSMIAIWATIAESMPILVEVQEHLALVPETLGRLDQRINKLSDSLDQLQDQLAQPWSPDEIAESTDAREMEEGVPLPPSETPRETREEPAPKPAGGRRPAGGRGAPGRRPGGRS